MRNKLNHGDAVISSSELENSVGKQRIRVDAYNLPAFSTDRFGEMGDGRLACLMIRLRQETETSGTYGMALQPITNRSNFD
ncbi:hypothetical protein BDN71DRAFT_901785 [Pleurotus eryngii]|uniref:Uncharacterized protein n=1 Tax=Pleurotus eryngii TaxID=5323 RepID=A0A9P5ZWS7_PLEER|nr:hypothetical protein BDN71DRAFT_901785 [Pleurotus eryngii]